MYAGKVFTLALVALSTSITGALADLKPYSGTMQQAGLSQEAISDFDHAFAKAGKNKNFILTSVENLATYTNDWKFRINPFRDLTIVDLRTTTEFEIQRLEGAVSWPVPNEKADEMQHFLRQAKHKDLPKVLQDLYSDDYVVFMAEPGCKRGPKIAAAYLEFIHNNRSHGWTNQYKDVKVVLLLGNMKEAVEISRGMNNSGHKGLKFIPELKKRDGSSYEVSRRWLPSAEW